MAEVRKGKKDRLVYRCRECGATSPKWAGQCGECGAWNSLDEERPAADAPSRFRNAGFAGTSEICALANVELEGEIRTATGFQELDRVLGGGLVQGSVILIGGDPGIGKSTLLLQAMAALQPHQSGLYITGEESPQQISMRAGRLGLAAPDLRLLAETQVERILEAAARERPAIMVIDSIQTLYTGELQSAPGSVSQVRESAAQLVHFAKRTGTSLFLVGHVDEGGGPGRSTGSRTHGRYRALFRGRRR